LTKKTKKKTKKTKSQTKKPKWTLVTYKGIEKARVQLGFTKSAMAEALEVTNSTFHNWRRGTTVPHHNQQEQLADRLRMLSGETTSISTKRTSNRSVRAAKGATAVMERPKVKQQVQPSPASLPAIGDVPRLSAIGTITAAWLSSQKAPSAGSTLKFVRDLNEALARGT
jgi:DNA-binding transcriptional regulator YiaG